MRTYLPNKVKYNKQFADIMYRLYKQMRYGIESCEPSQDNQLITLRKQLVEWEANEDDGALSETKVQLKTWLGVKYDDVLYSKGGTGYFVSGDGKSPTVGLNYMNQQQAGQNIIEINSGGCITRINLNPSIVINQNNSFVFSQPTPALIWNISHNMNLKPNVRINDLTGADIVGTISYIDDNTLRIIFNQAVAGKAYLS
jgi:hypothetical protein